jgi:hypothetical protein
MGSCTQLTHIEFLARLSEDELMVSCCRRYAAPGVVSNGICGLTPAAMCYHRSAVAKDPRILGSNDSQLRHPDDQPAIGLLLCKTRDNVIAEYALRDITKPIGVAQWQTKVVQSLPEPLRSNLPTIEEIEKELADAS